MTVNSLTYRNYTHSDNEITLRSVSKNTELSPRGEPTRLKEEWTFEGILIGDSESELTTKIAALENAYSVQGGNLAFGTTQHKLLASGTYGGPVITRLVWTNKFATEYVNLRSYEIQVTAFQATQSWFAVGKNSYPLEAAAIFGRSSPPLLDYQPGLDSPEVWRGYKRAYRRTWTFTYLAGFPLYGSPTTI
mgnify:CR=1 FL=1